MSVIPYEPSAKLNKDVKQAAANLGKDEARFLVDTYYSLQDFRIQSANQVRSILKSEDEEPHETLAFFGDQFSVLEKQVKTSLDIYSNSDPLGQWTRLHVGIGPVIAAGLLAHIDIERAPYASSIHRFAGLLPHQKKVKGVKRDWNQDLKVLCWKMSDSFVKLSNHPECYYGHIYRHRKEIELERDKNGANAEVARLTLEEKAIKDPATLAIYKSGHLPDGRLDLRARRHAAKRFLSHYFESAWVLRYSTEPPRPYVESHLGHQHIEDNPFVPRIDKI